MNLIIVMTVNYNSLPTKSLATFSIGLRIPAKLSLTSLT